MKKMFLLPVLFLCSLLIFSVPLWADELESLESSVRDMQGRSYYLGYNLHADITFNKISSVNYQLRGGLIPWGTPVKITAIARNRLVFEDLNTKRSYSYEFHWKTRRANKLSTHLSRLFVKDVAKLKEKVAGLADIDKDGIYEGRAKPGMSREGVLIAIGYPPEFATKDPMIDREWQYWRHRWGKMTVSFSRQGTVSEIAGVD